MKTIIICIILFPVTSASFIIAQIAQGPATGSIPSGIILSTDNFSDQPSSGINFNSKILELNRKIDQEPYFIDYGFSTEFDGSNYVEDNNAYSKSEVGIDPVLIQDFAGFQMGNYIPPDPDIAVGPDYILAIDNGQFAIWDKLGVMLKHINADSWVSAIVNNPAVVTDPKVLYDHYANRWIMVWLTINDVIQDSYWTVSVSDDSNPLGTWYNWALPSDQNGSTSTNSFGDYEGVGFDENAIYITGNFFTYSGFYQYTKIRIVPKAQLYQNTAGSVSWTDFWEIKTPTGLETFGIRPVHHYSSSPDAYFVYADDAGGNTLTVIKISNPLNSPTISGVNIPVTNYSEPPPTDQLGGGSPPISNGGAGILYEPIFKNGFLYAVHTVKNPISPNNSAIRYLKINVNSNSTTEDIFFGSSGYYYVYATIAVDQGNNIAFGFGRSADNEYMGAYYAARLAIDPPNTISGSYILKQGLGNYVVTYGGGINRWGDYQGIFLDPSSGNIWMHTEYVVATNTWGTWIGEVRIAAMQGVYGYTSTPEIDFGNVQVGSTSQVFTAEYTSLGTDPITITYIPSSVGPFLLTNVPTFPVTLNTYESLLLDFVFTPIDTGYFEELYPVTSNDPQFSEFTMRGRGYVLSNVQEDILYGYSGVTGNGKLITINRSSGSGTIVGPTLRDDIKAVSINPGDSRLYGMTSDDTQTKIFWIDAVSGVATEIKTVNIGNMEAMAFDKFGDLYTATGSGKLYQVIISNGNYTLKSDSHISISGMTFNYNTNELFVCNPVGFGRTTDKIYKVFISNGASTILGTTGFHPEPHNSLAFDGNGNLYCAIGSATSSGKLIQVNTSTANGTLVGSIGFNNITGMALLPNGISAFDDKYEPNVVYEYRLDQNYPNPFNPSTKIKYSVPQITHIQIKVFDILGNEIVTLVSEEKPAGKYEVEFDGTNLPSGIYFYQLKAGDFVEAKKMILMK